MHLRKAMDIFANLFIAPLMTESCSERELEAIENEFRLQQNNDSTRVPPRGVKRGKRNDIVFICRYLCYCVGQTGVAIVAVRESS